MSNAYLDVDHQAIFFRPLVDIQRASTEILAYSREVKQVVTLA